MQTKKTVRIGEVDIQVRELTGMDIDEWLLADETQPPPPLKGVELMLLPPVMPVHIPIKIVTACTGLGSTEISTLPISQATKLYSAVLEVNDFLRYLLASQAAADGLQGVSGGRSSVP